VVWSGAYHEDDDDDCVSVCVGNSSSAPESSPALLTLLAVAEVVLAWTPDMDGALLLNSVRLVQVRIYNWQTWRLLLRYLCLS
jgi:hypothetical protein